jgi:hypothetical protein
LDFIHCSILKKLENTMFWKLDLFTSSCEEDKTPTQVGPIERANLNIWITQKLKLKLPYDQQSVRQSVLVSGHHWGL